MKLIPKKIGLCTLLVSALLTGSARALDFNVDATNINNSIFGVAGWDSGVIALPSGTTIGATPLELNLLLSDYLDAGDALFFGLGGINPAVAPGGLVFDFTIELYKDGGSVSLPHGFPVTNSFPDPVDNLWVSWGPIPDIDGLTFNEVRIVVGNQDAELDVTEFRAGVRLPMANPVPDASRTALLVPAALLGLVVVGRRKALRAK